MSRELLQQVLTALRISTPFAHALEYYEFRNRAIKDIEAELAKPEQEPYFCKDCGKGLLGEGHIHTCSPQVKRQWVGLTDDEVLTTWLSPDVCKVPQCDKYHHFYVAIKSKLKEKNT